MQGSPEQFARLHDLLVKYVDISTPHDDEPQLSPEDARQAGDKYRAIAVQITEMLFNTGLYGEIKQRAGR